MINISRGNAFNRAREYRYKLEKTKTLNEHFKEYSNKKERNHAIINALEDGYTQAEIGRYLKLTPTAIAKVRKKYE